ncbi:hypothetical protein AVEN_217361-1 [Araneus ventricosus]|uniref:Uncharacterized protein n=1 Tax=Araneus ventricosus TaxID=182803 RepID=A0A4Y2S5A2_ARAVE|nr:hypothetical protein AVEN_217361-1 [Araneus ventricosus]
MLKKSRHLRRDRSKQFGALRTRPIQFSVHPFFSWVIHGSAKPPVTAIPASFSHFQNESTGLTPTQTPPPPRMAFVSVREARSPSSGSYFIFMTECAKWKASDFGFPNFSTPTVQFSSDISIDEEFWFEVLQMVWNGHTMNLLFYAYPASCSRGSHCADGSCVESGAFVSMVPLGYNPISPLDKTEHPPVPCSRHSCFTVEMDTERKRQTKPGPCERLSRHLLKSKMGDRYMGLTVAATGRSYGDEIQ